MLNGWALTLKNSLPREASLLICKAIDPSRALILHETCLYRISELAESAYENLFRLQSFNLNGSLGKIRKRYY